MAKVKKEKLAIADLKKAKKPKVKKPRDIRSVFREALAKLMTEGGVSKVMKPWMSTKAFLLIDDPDSLQAYCDDVLANSPKFEFYGYVSPVVALDTETLGLDTRLFIRLRRLADGTYKQYYEIKTDIAGICLSADGIKGVYIPVVHEYQDLALATPAKCIDRKRCADILQKFFDQVHLVFYNAKFDREIMRLTMGIVFRPYPFFEDVQACAYINDPKANLEDKKQYTGDAGGLKSLTRNILKIEQIELEEIARVRCDSCPDTGGPFCRCTLEQKKEKKHGLKKHFAPFSWVPVELALWYAGADGICTWLLWKEMYQLARSRKTVHRIDHELIDALSWIERQRFLIDTDRTRRTVEGHQKKMDVFRAKLYKLGIEAGYQERATDEGEVLEKDRFNPSSNPHLQTLLCKVKGYTLTKKTPKGGISCDAEVMEDLFKLHPDDQFLATVLEFNDYKSLHPGKLSFDPSDHSARIYLKQNVVAGGRLSSSGGDFEKDGGFGLNSQAVKKVESYLMWKIRGNILSPDTIPEDQIEHHEECELHQSCFKEVEKDGQKVKVQAPGILHNHIGQYLGYAVCLVPGCKTCAEKFGIIIPDAKIDANEVINLRCLFHALTGWTFFSVDYGNIEMRAAANVSGEPEFINEFLHGKGDFHSLTASKVFPEFNDPNTPKAIRKKLRDLAKIINFALLYGGTEYAIYENMHKQDPLITRERARKMVADYWAGVPVFYAFVKKKQTIAREQMICTTTTGRVIKFQSAMDALHIHVPNEEERKNYWKYRDLNKKAEQLKKDGDAEEAGKYFSLAQSMWKNLDTGVRNCMDYNKFMGKIQRVSVNVPLQGLAGDFMRMSLNKIFQWVVSDPEIAAVILLHCTVHDEIDFSVKDEYVPFVLPRITRLMKLRKLHERLKWPVPIECDAEYGSSWDVEHHVTGDDDHAAAAWTEIKSMSTYLPAGCDAATVRNLRKALLSGDPAKVAKVDAFLKENLHERAYVAARACFCKKVKGEEVPQTDPKEITRALIAALQLDEFWRIDNTPDDQPLETLAEYEARNGLTVADRNPSTLATGPLGSLPLDAEVTRYIPEPLKVYVPPPNEVYSMETPMTAPVVEVAEVPIVVAEAPVQASLDLQPLEPFPEDIPPTARPVWLAGPPWGTVPFELKAMTEGELQQLHILIGGKENYRLWVKAEGEIFSVPSSLERIPDKFLKKG